MKTRLLFVPYQLFAFQPYNGFDVEIDEAKVLEYMQAIRRLDDLHEEIRALLEPQAEAVDQAVADFFKRNGLRDVTKGEP